MSDARPEAAPSWLSLPPAHPAAPSAVVGAPFAAPLLRAMSAGAPAGMLAALFSTGAAAVAQSDRPSLALDPNPLALLPLTVQLTGPEPDEIASAFTRLLDQPYRGRPWGQYLQNLYLTSCPACWRPAVVEAYRWQGSPPALMAKQVRCDYCEYAGEALAGSDDQARAAEAEAGPALRWEMMARVIGADDPLRARAEQALAFYTPRNLWVLWQTLRILREVALTRDQRRALQWTLALALWQGSSLAGQDALFWQATLRRPRRFIERNLWLVLHEALAHVQRLSGSLRSRGEATDGGFDGARQPSFSLAQRWPVDFQDRMPPGSVGLALFTAPPPLSLYWLMQFVWSGWLFGEQAAMPMRDLLALRPGSDELLRRLLADAMGPVDGWLQAEGRSLVQWRWQGENDPSLAVLSALPAFDGQIGVAACGEDEWAALAVAPKSSHLPAAGRAAEPLAAGAEAMRHLLQARGEPAPPPRLRPAILAAWRQQAALEPSPELAAASDALLNPLAPPPGLAVLSEHGEAWEPGDQPWWWLLDPPQPWQPASDRAERELLALLGEGPIADGDALAWTLTRRLPLILVPDRPWIEALLLSYTEAGGEGLHLRPEDDPDRRAGEIAELAQRLLAQGQDMGFEATRWSEEDVYIVEWQRQGARRASFIVAATTALTPRVWHSRALIPGLSRFLVLPGGRASLLQWRFDHQPLWASAAATGGWTFVKFRHLREMLADSDEEPDTWLAHLGLDAVTVAHGEQMRLF